MICTNFSELTSIQRVAFIGELVHAAQSDNRYFEMCQDIVKMAELDGLFEGVKILPTSQSLTQDENFKELIN